MFNDKYDDWFTNNEQSSEESIKKEKTNGPKRGFGFSLKRKKRGTKQKKRLGIFSASYNKILLGIQWIILRAKNRPLMLKILFTIWMIAIFRIMASITVPGVIVNKDFGKDSGSFIGIMDTLGGGTLRMFSIAALGISPYITASIIITLLKSGALPAMERLAKSGPKGKRRINIITRIITLLIAIPMSITMIQQFSSNSIGLVSLNPAFDNNLYKYFVIPAIMIGGSMFTLFLGEQITAKGVGNGTSLIIFSGVAARLPIMFENGWKDIVGSTSSESIFIGVMNFIVYAAIFLLLIFVVAYIYRAERHVPIQNSGSGMTMDSKQMSRLPIKLNPGGVMPVIFALMIITLPLQIVQFFHHQNLTRIWIENNLKLTAPLGLAVMVGLIFVFTIVMSFATFNTIEIAENFKKQGTFIPGVRPGDETERYLSGIIVRLSIFSGFYLSVVTSVKYIQQLMGMSSAITYGGTAMIILVTVAIETINQLKARDKTQKISRAKIKANASNKENLVGGLLW